jgi:hypothetical protein
MEDHHHSTHDWRPNRHHEDRFAPYAWVCKPSTPELWPRTSQEDEGQASEQDSWRHLALYLIRRLALAVRLGLMREGGAPATNLQPTRQLVSLQRLLTPPRRQTGPPAWNSLPRDQESPHQTLPESVRPLLPGVRPPSQRSLGARQASRKKTHGCKETIGKQPLKHTSKAPDSMPSPNGAPPS